MKTKFVMSDIHGNFLTFMALIDKVAKENNINSEEVISKMVVCGDLEDRGPDSCSIIQFCIDNKIPVVMGNHELMMLDSAMASADHFSKRGHFDGFCWTEGALETMESYLIKENGANFLNIDRLHKHLSWMKNLPLYIEFKDVFNEEGRYLVVSHSNIHNIWNNRGATDRATKIKKEILDKLDSMNAKERAEYKTTQEFRKNNNEFDRAAKNAQRFENEIVWGRDYPKKDASEIYNVHGHTPQKDGPRVRGIFACIDTGCFYNRERGYNQLTCLQFPEMKITTQINIDREEARAVYGE